MAENSKGGILNKTEKFLRRRKTKVLQSLGKTGKTTDEQILEDSQRLERQQEIANRFQKDLRNYIHTAKALALASKTFYNTLSETYEPEWEGHSQITDILSSVDVLWQDFLQKLQEQVQDPLTKYLAYIPQIKARVAKRGRKLIDYDNAKHNLEVQQSAKKKDDAKITKAQEDLDQAKKIYDELNNELHTELPEFYNSRVTFYGNAFQHMFEAEHIFHQEIGKGAEKVAESSEKLSKDNEKFTYTPRRNIRHTVSHDYSLDSDDKYRDSPQIPFFFRHSDVRSDEHVPNGHSENGNSGYESPQPESPGPANTPNKAPEPDSPGPSPSSVETPVKADVTVENGDKELDTSKESVEEGQDYENTDLSQQQSARQSAEVKEVTVTENEAVSSEQVTIVTASKTQSVQSTTTITMAEIDQTVMANEQATNETEGNKSSGDEKYTNKDLNDAEYINVAEVNPVSTDQNKDKEINKPDHDSANITEDVSIKERKEPDGVKIEVKEPESGSQIYEIPDDQAIDLTDAKEPKEETKVNGVDLDTSTEQELPDYPPPQPPSSEPPPLDESPKQEQVEVVNAVDDDDDDEEPQRDSLYQVPPPAKPIDELPQKYVKTVIATHPYKGEDEDELSFESGEVLYVIEYDDPEEQDPGWLMGVRKLDNKTGVFPENFTKAV